LTATAPDRYGSGGGYDMRGDGFLGRTSAATLVLLVVGGAGTASAQSVCAKMQWRVAAEGARATARCHAKAAATGAPVDPECVAAAAAKLSEKWAKATLKGDCPTAADAAAAQGRVDAFIDGIADLLTPPIPSRCCATGSACYAGPSIDGGTCLELLGTLGAPGSICDGATGACVPPPGTGGSCCAFPQFSMCTAGPTVPPAGCVDVGGLDVPNAVCLESGACVMP
jgi:hypothetical protein